MNNEATAPSPRRSPLGAYLRARRLQITPEQAGLRDFSVRRVNGLRREEVAERAGVSREYYVRLEQGREPSPSAQVVRALAKGLDLDRMQTDYMEGLVHPMGTGGADDEDRESIVADIAALIERWSVPAYGLDRNLDIVASNPLARALGGGAFDPGRNIAINYFSDRVRAAREQEWASTAPIVAAALRQHSSPHDPRLQEILTALADDADFTRFWSRHDTRPFGQGHLTHEIPTLGIVTLRYHHMAVVGQVGYSIVVYGPEDDVRAAAALAYLNVLVARQELSP